MSLSWYPKYPGDYARDTQHLSLTEDGAYNRLMDHYYANGGLPQLSLSNASSNASLMPDHSRYYRLCKAVTKEEMQAVDNVLEEFFYIENGRYEHDKMRRIYREQKEKHEKRVAAGRKGGHSKAASNAKAKLKQPEPEPEPEPDSNKESIMSEFEEFWLIYPRQRRGNKQKAQKAYKRALTRATSEEIYNGLKAYIASSEVKGGFAKGAEAWLNDDRWTVEYARAGSAQPTGKSERAAAAAARGLAANAQK